MPTANPLVIKALSGRLAVCRLSPDASPPEWALAAPLYSVTRTEAELSVVCAEEAVPEGVRSECGWRALEVQGPLDFAMTGVMASLTAPLAAAQISVFTLSTFDTDYLLVRDSALEAAVEAFRAAGFLIHGDPGTVSGGK